MFTSVHICLDQFCTDVKNKLICCFVFFEGGVGLTMYFKTKKKLGLNNKRSLCVMSLFY